MPTAFVHIVTGKFTPQQWQHGTHVYTATATFYHSHTSALHTVVIILQAELYKLVVVRNIYKQGM